ncbi:MAG TPA: hypothetical protein VJ872_12440 [Nocardioides sp.]|nr:hypothetical protein [Nocardioides sp.]
MTRLLLLLLLLLLPAVAALAATSACGSSPSAAPTPAATTASTTAPTTAPTTGHVGTARNLPLTPAVRRQLLGAATRSHQAKPGSFSGFEHGSTYYAYDRATRTWWAAGALVAVDPTGSAAVSLNDEGAYDVLHRTAGGTWVDRLSGEAGNDRPLSRCEQWPPRDVLLLWHWSQKVCAQPRWR